VARRADAERTIADAELVLVVALVVVVVEDLVPVEAVVDPVADVVVLVVVDAEVDPVVVGALVTTVAPVEFTPAEVRIDVIAVLLASTPFTRAVVMFWPVAVATAKGEVAGMLMMATMMLKPVARAARTERRVAEMSWMVQSTLAVEKFRAVAN